MNILYVYAHPRTDSLNAELKRHAMTTLQTLGASLELSDLYAQQFEPAAPDKNDISIETGKISRADHIILQFPLWWFSTPAILKGWLDQVFIPGFAYDKDQKFDNGLLSGKTASFIITMQSPHDAYQRDGVHGSSLDEFLLPIHHSLYFTGIKTLKPFTVYDAHQIDADRLQHLLNDYNSHLSALITAESEIVYPHSGAKNRK